jgi:ribonuclease HII
VLRSYHQKEIAFEAGCDEAGRGCLAGPVFAAAVILPLKFRHKLLNDSKQVKASDRDALRVVIEKEAVCYAVASVDNEEIDRINILQASFRAMHLALEKLQQMPGYILVDGNRFIPYGNIPHACIIKGDGIYASIAAASILAKTYRDEYMQQLHQQYPHFGWQENKGYPTISHRNAIREHGDTPYHRKTFRLLPAQIEMDFADEPVE